jgi:hypothetical protein
VSGSSALGITDLSASRQRDHVGTDRNPYGYRHDALLQLSNPHSF